MGWQSLEDEIYQMGRLQLSFWIVAFALGVYQIWIARGSPMPTYNVFDIILYLTLIGALILNWRTHKELGQWKQKTEAPEEIAEWVEICEGLKNYLTPEIDTWEFQRKAGNIANETNLGQTMLNQRKLFYDKVTQKLKEYKDKKPKN